MPKGRCEPVFLTCKLLQGNKVKSDHKNNIVVHSSEGDIIQDCCIKIYDGLVAGVEFLQETGKERAQLANALTKKNLNDLHAK